MAGIMDKLKNAFGGKKEFHSDDTPARRIPAREEEPGIPLEEQAGERWRAAKKWREEKQMQEPLVKRGDFKRKL